MVIRICTILLGNQAMVYLRTDISHILHKELIFFFDSLSFIKDFQS